MSESHADIVARLSEATGKRILMPEATSLVEVATYIGPYETDNDQTGTTCRRGATNIGGNLLTQYANVDMSQIGGPKHYSVRLEPTEATVKALTGELVTNDDHLSWKLVAHKSSGLVLVIVQHSVIIGSRWVAYVDPLTVPAPEVKP